MYNLPNNIKMIPLLLKKCSNFLIRISATGLGKVNISEADNFKIRKAESDLGYFKFLN